jgi:hypothetical protein
MVVFGLAVVTTLGGASAEYDEGVYWQSLRSMALGHSLFSAVFSSQPPLFLISLFPVYLLAGQTLAAARLAILFYAALGLVATWWIGRRLVGPLGGTLACLLLACEPLYVAESHTLQAEIPMLACALLGIALALESRHHTARRRRTLVVISGVICAIAIMIKLFAVVALVPAALYVAAPSLRTLGEQDRGQGETVRDIAYQAAIDLAALGCGVVGTCLLVLLPFADRLGLVYDQVIRFHLVAGTIGPYHWQDALGRVWGVEWSSTFFREALAGIILAGVFAPRGRQLRVAPILLWLALSFAELVQQHPLLPHHYVILSPLLAITLGVATAALIEGIHRHRRRVLAVGMALNTIAGVVLLALALVTCARNLQRSAHDLQLASALHPNQTQQAMVRALQRAVPPGGLVISDDQYVVGLANRDVPPELVDTSLVRFQAGYLTGDQLEAIVARDGVTAILFTGGRFSEMLGFHSWVEAHYTLAVRFDGGQTLYVLEPASASP